MELSANPLNFDKELRYIRAGLSGPGAVAFSDSRKNMSGSMNRKDNFGRHARHGRPLVSFYVITYNQQEFIHQAVMCAFRQNYQPLQIVLSDDCSTDRTFSILQELVDSYRGPHEVLLRRNPSNLGVGAHINEILGACRGEIIIASAGDDWSVPERVERLVKWWDHEAPKAALVYSNMIEAYELSGSFFRLDFRTANPRARTNTRGVVAWTLDDHIDGRSLPLHGASFAYRREVFDSCGPLWHGIVFEDNVLNLRAEILGEVALCPEFLVYHRNHPRQVTNVYSKESLKSAVRSRRRLKWSDVQSLRQNRADLDLLGSRGLIEENLHARAQSWLLARFDEAEAEYRIEFDPWPARARYLLENGLRQKKCKLNRRLVLRSLAPDALYTLALQCCSAGWVSN